MISTCPNCLSLVNHDDGEAEVDCPDCKTHFVTVYRHEEHDDAGMEFQEGEPVAEPEIPSSSAPPSEPEPPPMEEMEPPAPLDMGDSTDSDAGLNDFSPPNAAELLNLGESDSPNELPNPMGENDDGTTPMESEEMNPLAMLNFDESDSSDEESSPMELLPDTPAMLSVEPESEELSDGDLNPEPPGELPNFLDDSSMGETEAAPEPDEMGLPGVEPVMGSDLGEPSVEGGLEPEKMDENFSESSEAFADIVSFGESLDPVNAKDTPVEGTSPSAGNAPGDSKKTDTAGTAAGCTVTSADSLQGFQIQEYLSPVSVVTQFDSKSPNPLQPAMDQLAQQAVKMKANAVIGMRYSLSADFTKVVASGTAVTCQKKG